MFGKSLFAAALLYGTTAVVAADLSLEPAINGAVSASGKHATQTQEDQVKQYIDWRLNYPYYPFWGLSAPPRYGYQAEPIAGTPGIGDQVFPER